MSERSIQTRKENNTEDPMHTISPEYQPRDDEKTKEIMQTLHLKRKIVPPDKEEDLRRIFGQGVMLLRRY